MKIPKLIRHCFSAAAICGWLAGCALFDPYPPVVIKPVPSSGCEWASGTYLSTSSQSALMIAELGLPKEITETPEWAALMQRAKTIDVIDPADGSALGFTAEMWLQFLSRPHADVAEDVDGIGRNNIVYETICEPEKTGGSDSGAEPNRLNFGTTPPI
jgi:hypothetical protein